MSIGLSSNILTMVLFVVMLLTALGLAIHNIILGIIDLKDEDKEEEE